MPARKVCRLALESVDPLDYSVSRNLDGTRWSMAGKTLLETAERGMISLLQVSKGVAGSVRLMRPMRPMVGIASFHVSRRVGAIIRLGPK